MDTFGERLRNERESRGLTLEAVAETLLRIVRDPNAPFRSTCAWGGPELCAARERVSDADWVALGALRDDEAYYERFAELFGLELRSAR